MDTKTSVNIRFYLSHSICFILGCFLMLICLWGIRGLPEFLAKGEPLGEDQMKMVFDQLPVIVADQINSEMRSATKAFLQPDLPKSFFSEKPWVKAVWFWNGKNHEFKKISPDGIMQRVVASSTGWLSVVKENVLSPGVSVEKSETFDFPVSESFTSFGLISVNSSSSTFDLIGETIVGQDEASAKGLLIDRNQFIEQRMVKLLQTFCVEKPTQLFLLNETGKTLLAVNHQGILDERSPKKPRPPLRVSDQRSLQGFLDGYQLKIDYDKKPKGDPGKRKAVKIAVGSGVLGVVALLGLIYFYIQFKAGKKELELQNDWVLNLAQTIRSPVHSMGVLLEGWELAKAEEKPAIAGAVHRELERMDQTCRRFIRLSRASRKHLEFFPQPLEIKPVIDDVIQRLRLRYPRFPGDSIQCDIADHFRVKADPEALAEIVEIALDNALKFSPEGKQVMVKFVENDQQGEIHVTDHGLGVLAEDVPHIGKAFYRGSAPGTDGIVGAGLGVYLARLMCNAQGGSFDLHSDGSGKGTQARIILPKE